MRKVIIVLIGALMLSGCATIVGERTQTIGVKSTWSEASVTITDEKDHDVFKGQTPVTVTLNKGDSSYWGGKSYTVRIA